MRPNGSMKAGLMKTPYKGKTREAKRRVGKVGSRDVYRIGKEKKKWGQNQLNSTLNSSYILEDSITIKKVCINNLKMNFS